MKRWSVEVPIAGYAIVEVEANNEADAINEALNVASMNDIESWEAMAHITRGNVCYAPRNRAEATEIEEDD